MKARFASRLVVIAYRLCTWAMRLTQTPGEVVIILGVEAFGAPLPEGNGESPDLAERVMAAIARSQHGRPS